SPVKQAAEEHSLEVHTPQNASDEASVARVAAWKADVAVVVAYGPMLRRPLRETAPPGWVNLHFSLLPTWRGAAPVQRAVMAGDEFTGASTFLIEEGLDTGPIVGSMTERIRPTDTAGDLLERLAHAGAPLMVQSIHGLADGSAVPQPQGQENVSYA